MPETLRPIDQLDHTLTNLDRQISDIDRIAINVYNLVTGLSGIVGKPKQSPTNMLKHAEGYLTLVDARLTNLETDERHQRRGAARAATALSGLKPETCSQICAYMDRLPAGTSAAEYVRELRNQIEQEIR
jgi:hypothetical protein